MSSSSFTNPATYHILSYGTLLGSTVFQSSLGGFIPYRCLPRAQFATLQKNLAPALFALQSLMPLAMLLTYPSGLSRVLPVFFSSSSSSSSSSTSSSPSSILRTASDRQSMWLMATMLFAGLLNWLYLGPQTTHVMVLRKHQETRDGKKSYDAGPHSEEMQELNNRFGILHGASTLVNLIGLGAMIWYGGILGQDLK